MSFPLRELTGLYITVFSQHNFQCIWGMQGTWESSLRILHTFPQHGNSLIASYGNMLSLSRLSICAYILDLVLASSLSCIQNAGIRPMNFSSPAKTHLSVITRMHSIIFFSQERYWVQSVKRKEKKRREEREREKEIKERGSRRQMGVWGQNKRQGDLTSCTGHVLPDLARP